MPAATSKVHVLLFGGVTLLVTSCTPCTDSSRQGSVGTTSPLKINTLQREFLDAASHAAAGRLYYFASIEPSGYSTTIIDSRSLDPTRSFYSEISYTTNELAHAHIASVVIVAEGPEGNLLAARMEPWWWDGTGWVPAKEVTSRTRLNN
jgi:hypothetical protein